jgi:SAM-dependent methyltransferase
MKESLEFYNRFDEKLIKDYASGNKRLVNAIENLARYIPPNNNLSVLDIGCGLGWSTYEFSRFFEEIKFEGVDLSPVLIDNANKLFQRDNLKYNVFDVTSEVPDKHYDAIVMIDVYEHIPKDDRRKFHQSLLKLLKPDGRILMACPSIYHQNYLKLNNPKGLQPVDEDVDLSILQQTAIDVEGEIIYFEYQKIWKSFDYLYVVIQNGVRYGSTTDLKSRKPYKVEDQNKRIYRLKDKLGINFKGKKNNSTLLKTIKKIKRKIFKRIK